MKCFVFLHIYVLLIAGMSNEDIKKQMESIWSMLDDMAATDKDVSYYIYIYILEI